MVYTQDDNDEDEDEKDYQPEENEGDYEADFKLVHRWASICRDGQRGE